MKSIIKKNLIFILVVGFSFITATTFAKSEKKNPPKTKREVQEKIKAVGGEIHFPAKTKISKIGSAKIGETYYHFFSGKLKKGGYMAYVFNNKAQYLGFYKLKFEPTGCEGGKKEGAILVSLEDSGDLNDNGDDPDAEKIRIKESGPSDNAHINRELVKFVPVPKNKIASTLLTKNKKVSSKPEFREWIITKAGKEYKVRAIYVDQNFGKVKLRGEASGVETWFPISSISKEDKEYIKQYK